MYSSRIKPGTSLDSLEASFRNNSTIEAMFMTPATKQRQRTMPRGHDSLQASRLSKEVHPLK